jgi:Flp pilus assembly protein TadG
LRRDPAAVSGRAGTDAGQSLVECALVLPFLLLVAFGVVETGYFVVDQHVVTKLSREGSNLISRNTTLEDAVTALGAMTVRPVDFNTRSRVILSVLKRGDRVGTANYDKIFLYQRRVYGALATNSKLTTLGAASFGGPPDYVAINPDDTAALQVTNVPADLIVPLGGVIYVTETATTHELLTPLSNLGIALPTTVYSIAYF